MGWLDFLRKRAAAPGPAPASAVVRFDEEGVTCVRRDWHAEGVRWPDLRAVLIQTMAAGPVADDLIWVLVGREGGCVVPGEAQGCDRLLERLQQLPGFDNRAVIEASSCVEDRTFVCWERPAAAEPVVAPDPRRR
jgi:hypothetical protein